MLNIVIFIPMVVIVVIQVLGYIEGVVVPE